MTFRSDALRWLASRNVEGGHVVTSKLYQPEESWTKELAWWVQVPAAAIRDGKTIHIVCESGSGGLFHYLRVPAAFFLQHLDDFATIGDEKINLFLAADSTSRFVDQRGPGRISLAQFEQG